MGALVFARNYLGIGGRFGNFLGALAAARNCFGEARAEKLKLFKMEDAEVEVLGDNGAYYKVNFRLLAEKVVAKVHASVDAMPWRRIHRFGGDAAPT